MFKINSKSRKFHQNHSNLSKNDLSRWDQNHLECYQINKRSRNIWRSTGFQTARSVRLKNSEIDSQWYSLEEHNEFPRQSTRLRVQKPKAKLQEHTRSILGEKILAFRFNWPTNGCRKLTVVSKYPYLEMWSSSPLSCKVFLYCIEPTIIPSSGWGLALFRSARSKCANCQTGFLNFKK